MATIRQLLDRKPTHATGERCEVPREWIQCEHCRRLLKKGHQATRYTPNKVYRCDECAERAPALRTYDDAKPGECSNCFHHARELPVTLTINGTEIDVCSTCARGGRPDRRRDHQTSGEADPVLTNQGDQTMKNTKAADTILEQLGRKVRSNE